MLDLHKDSEDVTDILVYKDKWYFMNHCTYKVPELQEFP